MLAAKPMRMGSRPSKDDLQTLLGNLVLLGTKACNYKYNVTGPNYGSLVDAFCCVEEAACKLSCKVGTRMRALGQPVCACGEAFVSGLWYKEGDYSLQGTEMVKDLVSTLDIICKHLAGMAGEESDEITKGMLNKVCGCIQEEAYKLRSNL